jgi:hypothetical protein
MSTKNAMIDSKVKNLRGDEVIIHSVNLSEDGEERRINLLLYPGFYYTVNDSGECLIPFMNESGYSIDFSNFEDIEDVKDNPQKEL